MTCIRHRPKPVWHDTGTLGERCRTILAAETPAALLLRLKGTRTVLALPWRAAYMKAVWLAADAKRAARKTRSVKRGELAVSREAAR